MIFQKKSVFAKCTIYIYVQMCSKRYGDLKFGAKFVQFLSSKKYKSVQLVQICSGKKEVMLHIMVYNFVAYMQ